MNFAQTNHNAGNVANQAIPNAVAYTIHGGVLHLFADEATMRQFRQDHPFCTWGRIKGVEVHPEPPR